MRRWAGAPPRAPVEGHEAGWVHSSAQWEEGRARGLLPWNLRSRVWARTLGRGGREGAREVTLERDPSRAVACSRHYKIKTGKDESGGQRQDVRRAWVGVWPAAVCAGPAATEAAPPQRQTLRETPEDETGRGGAWGAGGGRQRQGKRRV